MKDFDVLVDLLGRTAAGMLRNAGVEFLRVYPDEFLSTACVVVTLTDDSWEARRAALTQLIEVRGMFADDLALDFYFGDAKGATVVACEAPEHEYAVA